MAKKIKLTQQQYDDLKDAHYEKGRQAAETFNRHIEAHEKIVNEDSAKTPTGQPGRVTLPNQELIDDLASQIGLGIFENKIYIPSLLTDNLRYVCHQIAEYLVNNCITILEPKNGRD